MRGNPEPEIVIKEKKRGEVSEPTLEDRILSAAAKFYSETAGDVERLVVGVLENNFADLLYNTIGFEEDPFRGLRLNSNGSAGRELRERAQAAARSVLARIDFSQVELTTSQIRSIQAIYRSELKEHVATAARQLAQEDARRVAAKILNIQLEEE